MPDSHIFDSENGNEEVARPEADERAGKSRDVAPGAPGLHEYTYRVKLRFKSRPRIATRTTHCSNVGARSGHQTL
jgi:hypothetical protein